MTLGSCRSIGLVGLAGKVVEVEADVADGLPAFVLVGLPDAALHEARDRVRAALTNAGCALPSRRITVNLSPATIPKTGSGFDLAVAAALLAATGKIPDDAARAWVHLGELGLDGSVRPVRGVLPAVMAAVRAGHGRVVVAAANAPEAALVPGAQVQPVHSLGELIAWHRGEWVDGAKPTGGSGSQPRTGHDSSAHLAASGQGTALDLSDVVGQSFARYALEVAAAGGHHVFFVGPPGAGKTMLAARLPSLLPDLEDTAAMEVTALHSIAGLLDPAAGLIRRPPFQSPHHTSTAVSMVGGGSGLPRPGSASLAHRGVLFLDEAPEFGPRVLDALRQPLESGELTLQRARGAATYPARFQLVLAANPCPCGRSGGKGLECTCPSARRRGYLQRLSGPLLDRVDLQLEVAALTRADLLTGTAGEPSDVVRARVIAARQAQRERFADTGWLSNVEVPSRWLTGQGRLPSTHTATLDRLFDGGSLSARAYYRLLRVAWTMADLDGAARPTKEHVDTATQLRSRERVAA